MPIVHRSFPLVAGLLDAELIFTVVFFLVVSSVLLRRRSIPVVTWALRIDAPMGVKHRSLIECAPDEGVDTDAV